MLSDVSMDATIKTEPDDDFRSDEQQKPVEKSGNHFFRITLSSRANLLVNELQPYVVVCQLIIFPH